MAKRIVGREIKIHLDLTCTDEEASLYNSEINRMLEEMEDNIKNFASKFEGEYCLYDDVDVPIRVY